MKFTVLFSAALLAGVLSSPATTENAAAPAGTNSNPEAAMIALFGNPAVVKAKAFEIKRSDLDQVVSAARSNLAAAGQQIPADLEVQLLNKLIAIQALLQTATPADQTAGKIEANRSYTNLLAQMRSPEDLPRLLKARGMTVEELQAKALQEAVAESALKRALGINITDEDAKSYYTQHPADFEQPEMVHAQHILLLTIDPTTQPPMPLSTNAIAAKHRQIEELRKRILAGEDFSALARQYSEDPSSKEKGGELPNFARGQMVPEFEAAAFSLGTNQVSDVVTTKYGFHLIKVLEKIPAKKVDFAIAEPEIKDGLAQLKIRKAAPDYIRKLRAEQQVEITDANLKSQDQELQAQAVAAEAAAANDGLTETNK